MPSSPTSLDQDNGVVAGSGRSPPPPSPSRRPPTAHGAPGHHRLGHHPAADRAWLQPHHPPDRRRRRHRRGHHLPGLPRQGVAHRRRAGDRHRSRAHRSGPGHHRPGPAPGGPPGSGRRDHPAPRRLHLAAHGCNRSHQAQPSGGRWQGQPATDSAALAELFEPDRDRLRRDPATCAKLFRGVIFSGSHPALAEEPLAPTEIVSIFLDGVRGTDHSTPKAGRC